MIAADGPEGRVGATGAAHVLIVEDSADVALGLQIVMESAGHRVSVAGSVAAGEAIAASSAAAGLPVDVMLLDLTLPDGDGLDLLASLEASGRLPRHTVALTGHDDDEVRDRCLAVGCGEVMLKPVAIRKLVARVNELIGL